MELNGHLRSFELVDLLQMLGMGKKTGTLLLRNSDEWVALVIHEGKLSRILSQAITYESFGKLLVELGILDEDLLEGVLTIQQTTGHQRRLGEIMKDYGLNSDSIERTIFSQVRSLMAQLLSWKSGVFSLQLNRVPSEKLNPDVRQLCFDQPIEVIDLLLFAGQELDEAHETIEMEIIDTEPSIISSNDLEMLILSLVRMENAGDKEREQNARFRPSIIRSFSAELRACNTQQEVLMLVMRAAGAVAGRGLLVQIDKNELYNLGHYNSSSSDYDEGTIDADDMISVNSKDLETSILGRAKEAGKTIVINWSQVSEDGEETLSNENEVNRWLLARLGSSRLPFQVRAFLIPIQTDTETLVLYGDDATWPIDYERLAELELMLQHAALTMERLRLELICQRSIQRYYQAA